MQQTQQSPLSGTNKLVVAGAGAFGTAIAERLAWNTHNEVILYSIETSVVDDINENHINSKYFPSRRIHKEIRATGDLSELHEADAIFLAIPSKVIEEFTSNLKGKVQEACIFINLSKGMAHDGAFLTENIPFSHTGSMKGPTFAVEVLNGFPSAFTFGGAKEDFEVLKKSFFKDTGIVLDHTADVRGVELMSVLKNMYAIGIGIVSGRYNSPNVDFIAYTKAVNEMRRFLEMYSCNPDTIFTYCGIGDLGLTALNDLSRNRTLGLLIGKGFLSDPNGSNVIEGLRTIKLFGELAREKGILEEFTLLAALYELMEQNSSLNDYYLHVLS